MHLASVLFKSPKRTLSDILNNNETSSDPDERKKDTTFMIIINIIKKETGYDKFITPETSLNDNIEISKEDLKKVLTSISKTFKSVSFSEDDIKSFKTVGDIVEHVKKNTTTKVTKK